MKNKTAFILLFILIAIGGAILYRPQNQPSAPATGDQHREPAPLGTPENPLTPADLNNTAGPSTRDDTPRDEKTIIYTENGFSPALITVSIGTTVNFTNQASSPLWMMYDSKKSTSALSGFDQTKESRSGETYSYMFTKKGTFAFYNHLDKSKVGVITVK
jgi:plastocyanin